MVSHGDVLDYSNINFICGLKGTKPRTAVQSIGPQTKLFAHSETTYIKAESGVTRRKRKCLKKTFEFFYEIAKSDEICKKSSLS
jgi:hypothetical protein